MSFLNGPVRHGQKKIELEFYCPRKNIPFKINLESLGDKRNIVCAYCGDPIEVQIP